RSLHDALPIYAGGERSSAGGGVVGAVAVRGERSGGDAGAGVGAGRGVRVGADGCGWFPGVGGDSGVVGACRGAAVVRPWWCRRQPVVRRVGGVPVRSAVRAWSRPGPRYQSPVWSRV